MSIKTELKPKLEEVHDLDPLSDSEPTIAYFHGCLGVIEAEKRLMMTGKNGAYLLRESDVKRDIFIISSINDSIVTHFVAPNNDGKYSVFHGIGNQEQGCCELFLGFQKAQGASL